MKRISLLFAVQLFLLCGSATAAEWFTPRFSWSSDVRSAYISRGKVCEHHPIQSNELDLSLGLSDYGRIGFNHWNYSSLSDHYRDKHRQFVPEANWIVYYGYDWKFAEDWSLDTVVMIEWMTFYGGKPENSPSSYEWRMTQTLKNPYVNPYFKVRYTFHSTEYGYYQVGLKRKFAIVENLSLTADVAVDFADGGGCRKRFGAKPDGSPYDPGALSVVAQLTFAYAFTENLSANFTVGQFEVVNDDGRDNVSRWYKRDLTFAKVGFKLVF